MNKLAYGVLGIGASLILVGCAAEQSRVPSNAGGETISSEVDLSPTGSLHPMAIEAMRTKEYPGSEVVIVEELTPGSNYDRYIASYESEGNTIRGLLTIPREGKPEAGYPLIVFVHGYIPPDVYRTTERYVAYQDNLARNGYITYKIDLRGHDQSEGEPVRGHFSEAYVTDTLNAIAAMKTLETGDPERIGYWGHSNGGEIGLRSIVASEEIDAAVFWAGVVGSWEGMLEEYNDEIPFLSFENRGVPEMVTEFGLPSENPAFWETVDPHDHLDKVTAAVELHHGTADDSVPLVMSEELEEGLKAEGKQVELFVYQGGDHNLGGSAFGPAMQRTLAFYEEWL